ncbi:MAG: transcription antitermination factor NusB [Burkholderiaceae bacterium]|nr:transcription antitermination factor NusB [Burkholderiaceae bacterium]
MIATMTQPGNTKKSNSGASPRRRAREFALQAIYAWLLQSNGAENKLDEIGAIEAHLRDDAEFTTADQKWFNVIWQGVTHKADDLRATFKPFVDRPLDELSPVEHGILLIGTFELTQQIEVPYRVAINEAVELAKSFGGTDGFKFINGVLDKVAVQVRGPEVARASRPR